MKYSSSNSGIGRTSLAVLATLIIASFGVDVIIENADACSYFASPPICFAPQALGETSEAPAQPDLLSARIERVT